MIKLVPRPHLHHTDDAQLVAMFCSELSAFPDDPTTLPDVVKPSPSSKRTEFVIDGSKSEDVVKLELMFHKARCTMDELNLAMETDDLPQTSMAKIGALTSTLIALEDDHRFGRSDIALLSQEVHMVLLRGDAVKRRLQEDSVSSAPLTESRDMMDLDDQQTTLDEEAYLTEQLEYCSRLMPSSGEVVFNGLVFFWPSSSFSTAWIRSKTPSKIAIFDMGASYVGVLFDKVQPCVTFLSQLVLPSHQSLSRLYQASPLMDIDDSRVRHWTPVVTENDVYVRLATVDDDLLSYPPLHVDFATTSSPTSSGSSPTNTTSITSIASNGNHHEEVIFRPAVRYSSEIKSLPKMSAERENELSTFLQSVNGDDEDSVGLSTTSPGVPVIKPLKKTGDPAEDVLLEKKHKKVLHKILKQAKGGLPSQWTAHLDPENKIYYVNPATGVSQWERPK